MENMRIKNVLLILFMSSPLFGAVQRHLSGGLLSEGVDLGAATKKLSVMAAGGVFAAWFGGRLFEHYQEELAKREAERAIKKSDFYLQQISNAEKAHRQVIECQLQAERELRKKAIVESLVQHKIYDPLITIIREFERRENLGDCGLKEDVTFYSDYYRDKKVGRNSDRSWMGMRRGGSYGITVTPLDSVKNVFEKVAHELRVNPRYIDRYEVKDGDCRPSRQLSIPAQSIVQAIRDGQRDREESRFGKNKLECHLHLVVMSDNDFKVFEEFDIEFFRDKMGYPEEEMQQYGFFHVYDKL